MSGKLQFVAEAVSVISSENHVIDKLKHVGHLRPAE